MKNFTSYLAETKENIPDFKEFISYVVSIIKQTVSQARKLQVASYDYFSEEREISFGDYSYRLVINNGISEISSLDFSGIQETALELLETAIELYNKRLTEKFKNCSYQFPKAKLFAKNNPRKIEETFVEMLKEAKDVFKDKFLVHGEVGESQVETLILSLGYKEHKPNVKLTMENKDSYVENNLKKGYYLSSKSYKLSPDFIIRFFARDLPEFKKLFPNYNIQTIGGRNFLYSEVKTADRKNPVVKGTETKNKDVGDLIAKADKEGTFLLGKEDKELLTKVFSLKNDYTVITTSGISTKSLKQDIMSNSLYLVKVQPKTKQRTYNVKDRTGKVYFSIEKRVRAPVSKNIVLTDKNIIELKNIWKLYKSKWYGSPDKKGTDELRGAFVYYLIHTEQEIPSHIVKNSYELRIKMDNLRNKLFANKSKKDFKAKEEMFPLLENLLIDKIEDILLEGWSELCYL